MFNTFPDLWLVDFFLVWLCGHVSFKRMLSIGRLDMAVCSTAQRFRWLEILSSDSFLTELSIGRYDGLEFFLNWLTVRGLIKPRSILFQSTVITEKIMKFLLNLNLTKVQTLIQWTADSNVKCMCTEKDFRKLLIRCSSITSLRFGKNQSNFTTDVLQALSDQQLGQLNSLSISNICCDYTMLKKLFKLCSSLEDFTVDKTLSNLFTPSVQIECIKAFKKLRNLYVHVPVNPAVLSAISKYHPEITSLSIKQCTETEENEYVDYVMDMIKSLVYLKSFGCWFVGGYLGFYKYINGTLALDGSIHNYWRSLFKFRHIVACTSEIVLITETTDELLEAIGIAVPELLILAVYMARNNSYTLCGVKKLLQRCRKLTEINLGDCDHLPVTELIDLLFASEQLTKIKFNHKDFRPEMLTVNKLKAAVKSVYINEGKENEWVFDREK
jgi:hypothetical protein